MVFFGKFRNMCEFIYYTKRNTCNICPTIFFRGKIFLFCIFGPNKSGLIFLNDRILKMGQIDPYEYMSGFGNHFNSEALPGALPKSTTIISIRVISYY